MLTRKAIERVRAQQRAYGEDPNARHHFGGPEPAQPRPQRSKNKVCVHGLLNGLPLCLFTREIPAHWPEGHQWTGHGNVENITCAICKQLAQESKGRR